MTVATSEAPRALAPGDHGYTTIPAGLDDIERIMYWRGFTRGAKSYGKRAPAPGAVHSADAPAPEPGSKARAALGEQLHAGFTAWRAERHPVAHKAAMAELRRYWRRMGLEARAAEVVDQLAPVKAPARKRATTRKLSAVPDTTDAGTRAAMLEDPRVSVIHVTDAPAPAPVLPYFVGAAVVVTVHTLRESREVPGIVSAVDARGRITVDTATDGALAPDLAHVRPARVDDIRTPAPVAPVANASERLRRQCDTAAAVARDLSDVDVSTPAARRDTRRRLADALRSADIRPAGAPWDAAALAIGLPR